MASWNQVEFGFSGDETCNFGPRVESGSALFQVDTTALISPSEQVTELPRVNASSTRSQLSVAADTHLCFFTEEGATYSGNLAFDSRVDALAWCSETILVVCERNGSVHFINSLTQTSLFSQVFVAQTDPTCATFVCASYSLSGDTGAGELLLLTADRLFVLSNLQLGDFTKDVEYDIKKIQKEMKMAVVDVSSEHTDGATSARHAGNYGNFVITTGHGESVMTIWSPVGGTWEAVRRLRPYISHAIVKLAVLEGGRSILVLTEKGDLGLLHMRTLTFVYQWNGLGILDFILLDTGDTSSHSSWQEVKLAVLTRPDTPGSPTSLRICRLQSLHPEYSLDLSDFTYLVQGPPQQEDVFFIEGVKENLQGVPLVTSLRLRCLAEVMPETRFTRLLHKKQFAKAEALAKDFDLDVELVYKVKANGVLDKLSPWCVDELPTEEVEQLTGNLRTCLERITDEALIVECCVKATPLNMEQLYELLLYAKQRLHASTEKEEKQSNGSTQNGGSHNGHGDSAADKGSSTRAALLNRILETLHRLATFHMVFGPDSYTPSHWADFLGGDLLEAMYEQLKVSNISTAFTIWTRHLTEFEESLTADIIESLLAAVPEDVPSSTLRPLLLREFLPFIIRKLPDALSIVAAWIQQKALNLEIFEPEAWPLNGLQTAQLLDKAVEEMSATKELALTTPGGSSKGCAKSGETCQDHVTQLKLLVRELEDLLHLHTKYNCPLTLAEYRKQTTESLIYRMLDQVPVVQLVPSVISRVVIPYMRERQLEGDKMLLQYVVDIAERQSRNYSGQEARAWEEKALAVIDCITELEYKVKAVLAVVQRVSLPWSPAVESLVDDTLLLKHALVEQLREQRALVQTRKIFLKYNLRNCILNERVIWKLTKYIIRQNRETALEDAFAVAHNKLMVYKEHLDFLIHSNKLYEAMKLLRSLPAETVVALGKHVMWSTRRELNFSLQLDTKFTQQRAIQATHSACDILHYVLTLNSEHLDAEFRYELGECLSLLEKLHCLQVEFDLFLSYKEFSKGAGPSTWTLLKEKVVGFFRKTLVEIPQSVVCEDCNSDKKTGKRGTWTLTKIYRLGNLLGISRLEMECEIVLQSLEAGQIKHAVSLARSLHKKNPGTQSAALLYQLAHRLVTIQAQADFVDECRALPHLSKVVAELANLATTHCSPELLVDCLELSKGCRLVEAIADQCEMGEYQGMLEVSENTKYRYENGKFDSFYEDQGLVLDSTVALPLANTYAISCIPDIGSVERLPYTQTRLAGSVDSDDENVINTVDDFHTNTVPLVQHLESNNQLSLALSCSADALFVAGQRLSSIQPEEKAKRKDILIKNRQKAIMHIHNLNDKIILKIFKQPECYLGVALGMLLSIPRNTATKLLLNTIKVMAQSRHKLTANIAMTGVEFSTIIVDQSMRDLFSDVRRKAGWAHRLNKIGLNKEAKGLNFVRGPERVLSSIVQHEAATLALLRQFTRTFELPEDDALVMFLQCQVLPPLKPGQPRAPLHRSQSQRAVETICQISSENKILAGLKKILKEVNSYDYERLQFVLEWIVQLDVSQCEREKSELVNHLLLYQRVSAPSEYELSCRAEGSEELVEAGALSSFSETRLPFHALVNGQPWKIISPELNASTVDAWVPMAKLLGLKVDQLYLITIKNMVQQYVQEEATRHKATGGSGFQWDTTDMVTDMIATIRKMLLLSNYETAMACGSWIVKELPMGSVKVLTLRDCLMLSQTWLESCGDQGEEFEKAQNINTIFRDTYRRLSTEQALHQHLLAEPELLSLSSEPKTLVIKLYHHASIQERAGHVSKLAALPDIHAAAAAICEINGLKLMSLRAELLGEWLPSNSASQQDMSMTLDAHNLELTLGTEEKVSEDIENLKRLVYLFQHGSLEKNVFFLLNYIYKGSSCVSTMCQIRAMRCLFMIANQEMIETTSKTKVETLEKHLQSLIYVQEMEQLHLGQTLQSFLKCNKAGLVRSIWRLHRHQKQAVKLVANLCLDYDIRDAPLWDSILKQMQAFGMLEHLHHMLLRLTEYPELWVIPSFTTMWREVLSFPLTEVSAPLTPAEEEKCLETLNLLHRCPCVLDLNLGKFAKLFTDIELPLAALSCVLLLPLVAEREKHVDRIVETVGAGHIRRQLDAWQTGGRQLPLHNQIKSSLYMYVLRRAAYTEMVEPAYAAELAMVLVKKDAVTDLFLFLLRNSRLTEVHQLLLLHRQYHENHNAAASAVTEPDEQIQVFAQLYGIEEEVSALLP